MKALATCTLLILLSLGCNADDSTPIEQFNGIKVYKRCIEGYWWFIFVNEQGTAIDAQQQYIISKGGIATIPIPVICNNQKK